jgi:hypothetical protein
MSAVVPVSRSKEIATASNGQRARQPCYRSAFVFWCENSRERWQYALTSHAVVAERWVSLENQVGIDRCRRVGFNVTAFCLWRRCCRRSSLTDDLLRSLRFALGVFLGQSVALVAFASATSGSARLCTFWGVIAGATVAGSQFKPGAPDRSRSDQSPGSIDTGPATSPRLVAPHANGTSGSGARRVRQRQASP